MKERTASKMIFLQRVICLVIGYAFGLIQTAYIIGKTQHVDIREFGSGNSGTTNAMRTLGKKAGIITFLVDAIKALVAITVARLIFKDSDYIFVLALYTGIGVILGHNFPFYMNFKGGKGIAASGGVIAGCYDWRLLLLAILTFALAAVITKYVSVGSLCVLTGFLIELIIFAEFGLMASSSGFNAEYKIESYILALFMTMLAFIRHRENIKRLMNGTERKIGEKKEA